MNKKLLILGAAALISGFFVFTAFDGKTREQQLAEIEQMATMKLDELRATKEQECTDKINTEAQRRFDEILAQRAADAAKPGAKPKPKPKPKPGGSGGATVEPLPQPSTPPTDPKKDKMEGGTNTQQKQDKMQGQPTTTDKKKAKMQSGGGGN